MHEEVDEVTGLSRLIIVDSPDEKKQPAIEIKGKDGKVNRNYQMPFGVFLGSMALVALFFGDRFLRWYGRFW